MRLGPAIPALLLILAGAMATAGYLFVFEDPTDTDDWQAAADAALDALATDQAADDIVRVHPDWTDEPLVHLVEVGDRLQRQRIPTREDLRGVDRIWLLTETGRIDEALAALPFDARPASTKPFDTVTLLEVQVPPVDYPYVFLDALDQARVTRGGPGAGEERCELWNARERRWDCGKRDRWLYVGEVLSETYDDPRRCIWANPIAGRRPLRITFPEVPLTDTLRIRAGLSLRAARSSRGADVDVRVFVGDDMALTRTIGAREYRWDPWDIDTSAYEGPRDVTVEVSASSPIDRFLCFDGWVLPEG